MIDHPMTTASKMHFIYLIPHTDLLSSQTKYIDINNTSNMLSNARRQRISKKGDGIGTPSPGGGRNMLLASV